MRNDAEEKFVAWMTTQTNANGEKFSQKRAYVYTRHLRIAPSKLELSLAIDKRTVFSCLEVDDFDRLHQAFQSAPNYREVNAYGHGAFSAGLAVYRRYLECCENHTEKLYEGAGKMGGAVAALDTQLNTGIHQVNFERPDLCAFTNPLECIIDGRAVRGVNWNWRDLLQAITEHFLRIDAAKADSFVFQSGRSYMTKQKPSNAVCRQLSNKKFIVVSYDIPTLVRMIGKLCEHCGVSLDKVVITYKTKTDAPQTQNNSKSFTIKEAVLRVLLTESRSMTVDEIYKKITEQNLYVFGAQNPVNVVRNIIESACDNSTYSEQYQANTPCFHFEKDIEGRRVYSLLSENHTGGAAENTSGIFDSIVDFEDGKNGLLSILKTHFQTLYGYSNINILWDSAQNELIMFLNDNAITTPVELWNFVYRVFEGKLTLSNLHIWQTTPNYPLNVRGITINLARHNGGMVTREQIDDYFSRIKIGAPTNWVLISQGELLFCNKATLVPADSLKLTEEKCKAVSGALKELFSAENIPYIVLRDIKEEWFARLPELATIKWTPMLLQEILRVCTNTGYRVITKLSGQALDTLGAAIVPNHSDVHTFADLVHCYCYEKYHLPYNVTAENLRLELRDACMLEGSELIFNMHKALKDYRFAFDNEKINVKILER